jgi:FixJ family two-component response regulator
MKAFRHGARDFVAKPFAGETLLAKVARVLDDVRAAD